MKTSKIIPASGFWLMAVLGGAQDIHFSQYNFSPLTLNPALTAAYKNIQATLHYKEQWRAVDAYRTSAATFEIKMSEFPWIKIEKLTSTFKEKVAKGLAFGINVFSDKAGDGSLSQFQASLSIAYHARIAEHHVLSGAMMGGIVQRSISPDGLRWNSQYPGGVYDPNLPSGENFSAQSHGYGDYAAGMLWSYGEGSRYMTANDHKFIGAGFSIYHLSSPPQSFIGSNDRLNWRWTAHANSLFGIKNSQISVGPSVLYMQQGALKEVTAGGLLKYKFREESKYTGYVKGAAVSLGCFYRNRDAVIPMFLLEMSSYSLGISYDTNISGLTAATSGKGGFEISLRFNSPSPFLYQNSSSRF